MADFSHSIESPERLDFNEEDDFDDLLGDSAAAGSAAAAPAPIVTRCTMTEEEEAELLGTDFDGTQMAISQEDEEADCCIADADVASSQHEQEQEQDLAAAEMVPPVSEPASTSDQSVLFPVSSESVISADSSRISQPCDNADFSRATATSLNRSKTDGDNAATAGFETESILEMNRAGTAQTKTALVAVATESTLLATTNACSSSSSGASQSPPKRRVRKRLLPDRIRSPRHSYPPDPNEIIDLTAESSDEDDSPGSTIGVAATRIGPDGNNNKLVTDSRDLRRPPKPISPILPPTSQPAVQSAQPVDLRQVIKNKRQLVFSEATAAAASAPIGQPHRRHSSMSGYATSPASQSQHRFGSIDSHSNRFPQQPAARRPQPQPPATHSNVISVRPFGGKFTGENFNQIRAGPSRPQSSFERRFVEDFGANAEDEQLLEQQARRSFHSSSRPSFGHSARHDRLPQQQRQEEHSDFSRPKLHLFDRSGDSRGGIGVSCVGIAHGYASSGGSGVGRGGGTGGGSLLRSNFAAAEEMRPHCRIAEFSGSSGGRFVPAAAPPPSQSIAMPIQRVVRVPFGAGYPSATNKTSVRIENCPDGLTEADLAILTDPLGPVCEYRLVPEYFKAFVRFFNEHQASEFVKRYNRTVFMGLELYMSVIN